MCGEHAGDTRFRLQRGRFDAGLNPHQRNRQLFADQRDRLRSRRVACNYQRLRALARKPLPECEGAIGDEVVVAFAVGSVERVGDVDERFAGQLRPDRPQHRQTAQTRVEYADRRS